MKAEFKKLSRHISSKTAVIIIFCIVTAILFGNLFLKKDDSHAADVISIEHDGVIVDPSERIQMTTSSITLTLKSEDNIYSDATQYEINWTLESEDHRKRAKIEQGSSSIYGILTAIEPGEVQIMVNVVDKTSAQAGIVASASCWVDIIFSIDTLHDDSSFKFLYDTDASRSFIKYSDDAPYALNLAFGNPENCQWSTENEEIVTIDENGVVTPVGAGRTNVVATYTPVGDTQTYTAYLPVYIFPKISIDNQDFFVGGTRGMATGDVIYTDAFFSEINTETIQEKVVWVIKKDINGVRQVIEDSLGNKQSDLIQLSPLGNVSNTPNIELQAKAGNYYIEFYPTGAYQSESVKTSFSPTVLNLTVYAEFGDLDKTILVNDAFNIAEAFNLTQEDFIDMFSRPNISLINGGDSSNYVTYDQETSIITAKQKGTVAVNVSGKSAKEGNILALCNPNKIAPGTEFNITLRIIDSFTLDRTSVVMYKGQSILLTPTFTSYSGVVSWSSSDSKYVEVSEGGTITALKETEENADVTITATLELDDGTIKRAMCTVKVEASIGKISINPSAITLEKGEMGNLTVDIKEYVTVAPFVWKSTNEKVCVIRKIDSDNKGCTIEAKDGGKATIILTNTINQTQVFCEVTVTVPITSITPKTPNIEMKLYKEGTKLGYSIQPSNATDTELIWESLDTSIATIDNEGFVTFVGPGRVSIIARAKSNLSAQAAWNINIIKTADALVLSKTDIIMYAGEQHKLEYTLEPKESILDVSFSTATNNGVVTVDQITGLITAKKAGTAQIFAKGEGIAVPSVCNVTVLQKSTGISFAEKEIIVPTGGTKIARVNIKPADSTDAISWLSLDTKIATVKDGEITGVSAGSTYVQAKTESGADAVIPVHVRDGVKGLALNVTEKVITVGEKLTLTPIFTPANPYNQAVKWSTTNGGIATVDNKGVVTAVGGGIAAIKCVSDDGGYQATCIVTVKEPAASISLNHTSYKLGLGKKVKLVATVSNPNATNKTVTWSTSNKKIATVNKSGKVTGKKIGKCTITATANDGSGMKATCSIRVVRKVTSIKLNRKTASVYVGNTFKLKKTIKPSNATIKTVTWSSEDPTIATVDNKGNVVGISPGVVKIKATAKDGSRKYAVCLVNVKEKVPSTGLIPSKSEIIMVVGTSKNVSFTTQPANSTDNLYYSSDNSAVASVNSKGKVTAKKIGSATIYATASSGAESYIEIRVVSLNRSGVTLRQYDSETIWVNGYDENVKWFSQNPLIATVQNGKIIGRKPGRTVVYAVIDGTKVRCSVRVTNIR